jgi:flagellar L-ring protein precursor FlgH
MVRMSWTSDRRPVKVGDIITVVVDERASASERATTRAQSTRSQGGDLTLGFSDPATAKDFEIGYKGKSDQSSVANRTGDLSTALSVRVTSVEAGGVAKIEGRRMLTIDGRKQEIVLNGMIRAEDVSPNNVVISSRIADATITYKGKTIGPKTGIFGKIFGMLWP